MDQLPIVIRRRVSSLGGKASAEVRRRRSIPVRFARLVQKVFSQKDRWLGEEGRCLYCCRRHTSLGRGARAYKKCYMRWYRSTANGRLRVRQASLASYRRLRYDPEWKERRKVWVWRWQSRKGRLIPWEVHELRWQTKRLERLVEAADNGTTTRWPSQRRRYQAFTRRNRLRNSKGVRTDYAVRGSVGNDGDSCGTS